MIHSPMYPYLVAWDWLQDALYWFIGACAVVAIIAALAVEFTERKK